MIRIIKSGMGSGIRRFSLPSWTLSRQFSQSLISVCFENGVKSITMTSPQTRNALSLEMLGKITENISNQWADPSLRCVVIQGEGKVFSSGHNLKEMTSDHGKKHQEVIFESCKILMHAIKNCPVPVIAVVNGTAVAAGCQLVAMCDIVIATEKSKFSTPGGNVGIFCSTPGVPLARVVPRKISAYMLMTGNFLNAEEALRAGLVSRLVNEKEVDDELQSVCESIVSKPRAVIALGKKFYYEQLEMDFTTALDEGGKVMIDNLQYKDAEEGIQAFIQKRFPHWCHTDEKITTS